MNINFRRIFGTASAVAVLMGTGVLAVAAPASGQTAQPWPHAVVAAQTATVFDLNGIYTDGGSARLRITDVNDILTVDMSSLNRPAANGVVINADTILVTFPDVSAFGAKLVAPGTIRWSNGSVWQKLTTVIVPDVTGKGKALAMSILQSAGLTSHAQNFSTCDTAAGLVDHQDPKADTTVVPGTLVQIYIAVKPTICP